MTRHMNLRGNKQEVKHEQEKLLKMAERSQELRVSWCRTFAYLSLLQFKEWEREKYDVIVNELSLLPSSGSAVQGYSAGKSYATLKLFPSEVVGHVLRDFLDYNLKRKD